MPIDDPEYQKIICKNNPKLGNHTAANCFDIVSGEITNILDGHSRKYPKDASKGAWLGCNANMPSKGEEANGLLTIVDKVIAKLDNINIPTYYPLMDKDAQVRQIIFHIEKNNSIDLTINQSAGMDRTFTARESWRRNFGQLQLLQEKL